MATCSAVVRGADPRSVLPSIAITRRSVPAVTGSRRCPLAASACWTASCAPAQPATAASSAAASVVCRQRRSVASHGGSAAPVEC